MISSKTPDNSPKPETGNGAPVTPPPQPIRILELLENTLGQMTGWTPESMLAIAHLLYTRQKMRYEQDMVLITPPPPPMSLKE